MLFQSRQDRRGIAIFVTTVKSQINHFLISVSGIVGMIFLIHRMRHFRRELFLPPENSTPIFGGWENKGMRRRYKSAAGRSQSCFTGGENSGNQSSGKKTEGKEEKED